MLMGRLNEAMEMTVSITDKDKQTMSRGQNRPAASTANEREVPPKTFQEENIISHPPRVPL